VVDERDAGRRFRAPGHVRRVENLHGPDPNAPTRSGSGLAVASIIISGLDSTSDSTFDYEEHIDVSTPTETNRDLLTVVATMRAKAGKEHELRAGLESVIEATRQEAGNVTYELYQGVDDPAVFTFYENWQS